MTSNLEYTKNYTELGAAYQLVRRLNEMGELSKETVFIDGTKLEACANKYTFVWKKSVGKWEEKMFLKIRDAVTLLNQEYLQSFSVSEETRTQDVQKICCFLEKVCEKQHTVFALRRKIISPYNTGLRIGS